MRFSSIVSSTSRFAAYAALLVGMMLSQCVCQNNRSDTPHTGGPSADAKRVERPAPPRPVLADDAKPGVKPAYEVPASLDVKDLDDDEKAILVTVLREQYDPCGKPMSFYERLQNDQTCDLADTLGAFAVDKISKGLSARQTTRALLKELSRRATKATFDLLGSPWVGDKEAKRVVVKFTDFQCPHCRLAAQPSKDLAKKHGAVLYVKMMPLEHHTFAKEAALAAMAAERQGKFWLVYNGLFSNQDQMSSEVIRKVVTDAGADMKQFEADLADPELAALLTRDLDEASRFKVEGTPTFFVDGYMVEYEQLEETLEAPPRQ